MKNQSKNRKMKNKNPRPNRSRIRHAPLLANTCLLTGSKSETSSKKGQRTPRLTADEIRRQQRKEPCQLVFNFPTLWEDLTPKTKNNDNKVIKLKHGVSTFNIAIAAPANLPVPVSGPGRKYVLQYSTTKRKRICLLG